MKNEMKNVRHFVSALTCYSNGGNKGKRRWVILVFGVIYCGKETM